MMSEWEDDELIRVPSHDTFSRVLRFTDFEGLSASIGAWLRERFPDICERYDGLKVLHVDGKATLAIAEKSKGENPIDHLNAMFEGESIGVEMKSVGEKENEISCLPDFLEKFNLEETWEFKNLDRTQTLSKKHGRLEKVTMIYNTAFIYEKLGTESF